MSFYEVYDTELYSILKHIQFVFLWFGLVLYISCNSYGHVGMVSSLTKLFFLSKLEQAVNQYFVHILSLVTDNNPSWMYQWKGGEWQ